jgi:hypothetical protein
MTISLSGKQKHCLLALLQCFNEIRSEESDQSIGNSSSLHTLEQLLTAQGKVMQDDFSGTYVNRKIVTAVCVWIIGSHNLDHILIQVVLPQLMICILFYDLSHVIEILFIFDTGQNKI